MERHAARHPGTPLFVCPVYDGSGWEPVWLEYGLVVDGRVVQRAGLRQQVEVQPAARGVRDEVPAISIAARPATSVRQEAGKAATVARGGRRSRSTPDADDPVACVLELVRAGPNPPAIA
jgi:hypothetical protein